MNILPDEYDEGYEYGYKEGFRDGKASNPEGLSTLELERRVAQLEKELAEAKREAYRQYNKGHDAGYSAGYNDAEDNQFFEELDDNFRFGW